MTADRIKEIQAKTAFPDSISVCQALFQVWNECQQDMTDKDKWTFDEILDACYPTLGRGSDWCDIVKRLREQY